MPTWSRSISRPSIVRKHSESEDTSWRRGDRDAVSEVTPDDRDVRHGDRLSTTSNGVCLEDTTRQSYDYMDDSGFLPRTLLARMHISIVQRTACDPCVDDHLDLVTGHSFCAVQFVRSTRPLTLNISRLDYIVQSTAASPERASGSQPR